jgi:hypothetical protein
MEPTWETVTMLWIAAMVIGLLVGIILEHYL